MQPNDILLVELTAGPRLARYIETKGSRLRLAIGRNREARLPQSRLIYETGVSASGFEDVERLREQAEAAASGLDLEEVWDIVCDDGDALTLDDIGELYWGDEPSIQQSVGLLIHLLSDDLRFVRDGGHFVPRDRDEVDAIVERRQRQAQRSADADELASAFRTGQTPGQTPETLSDHQADLVAQVRGFVIHGDEYPRANAAKRFLETAGIGGRDTQRAAFDALVRLGVMDADEHLALERAGIVAEFPDDALADADRIDPAPLLSDTDRADMTDLFAFTIDGAETRDRDDALSVEIADDGSLRIGIHITDAGALIESGSAVDVEADRRMSSLYLPDRMISMMPPAVSTGAGSLNPGETRPAVSVLASFDADCEMTGWKVVKSAIRSARALSYEEADAAIADSSHPLNAELDALNRVAASLRAAREAKGALRLDRAELSVKVDAAGAISVSVEPRDAPARGLVEECMVLCNSLLARYCMDNDLPAPFRSQPVVDVSDIEAQTPEGALRVFMITRRLSAASVSVKPSPHGGLGVDVYTQATSPLRRYPDLLVQRQISHHLRTGETLYDEEAVTSVAHRADMQIRQMSRMERDRRQHFFLKWLDARRVESEANGAPAVHRAIALENHGGRRAAQLDLVEWPVRTRTALPSSIKPGDEVSLRLHGVDLWRRTAQFTTTSRKKNPHQTDGRRPILDIGCHPRAPTRHSAVPTRHSAPQPGTPQPQPVILRPNLSFRRTPESRAPLLNRP